MSKRKQLNNWGATKMNEYYDSYNDLTPANQATIDKMVLDSNPDWLVSLEPISSFHELAAIAEGGCESGAYMPAVTYYTAKAAVFENSDIEEYAIKNLEACDCFDGLTEAAKKGVASYCVYLCSVAVESYVNSVLDDIQAAISDLLDEQNSKGS